MKKLALLLIAVFVIAAVGKAQPGGMGGTPEERAKRQTDQIKEAVSLNADQEKKVYDLNLENGKKMQEMMQANQGGGFEGMRETMTKNQEEMTKKMKGILTAEQFTQYEKYLAERQQRGPGGGGF
jgi:periplasmic protein CpxP/Spy